MEPGLTPLAMLALFVSLALASLFVPCHAAVFSPVHTGGGDHVPARSEPGVQELKELKELRKPRALPRLRYFQLRVLQQKEFALL